jgi:MFS family permease
MIRSWSPSLRATAAILLLGFTANAVSGAFWVVYATEQIGLSTQQWGLILLIETLLRNVAYVPAGVLADRLGRSRFVALSLALSTVSLPAFVLATGFWGALAVRGVIGVSNALFTPACCALVADTVPRESRGRVTAAIGRGSVLLGSTGGGTGGPGMGFLMTLPVMFGALGGGYLYDLRPALPWLVALLALLVASLLAWRSLSDPREAHV